jgi:hypothetical protein
VVRSPTEAEDVSSTLCAQPALGPTQRPIQWVPGAPSSGGEVRPGRDADHSPSSSAEVKKERGYTSSHPKRLPWRILGKIYFSLICLSLRSFNMLNT